MSLNRLGEIGGLVSRSLQRLEAENPTGIEHVSDALGDVSVALQMDGERFQIGKALSRLQVSATARDTSVPEVQIAVNRETVDAVLAGQISIYEAVMSSDLLVQGAIGHLAAAHDAIVAYALGVADLPSRDALVDDYKDGKRRK